ncbi:MAG: ABC transporter permease [Acidobacteriota bacterium]
MLKNYFKTAFKVFLRRKFFTFISLFAISFTLVVLMVATAIIDHVFGEMPPEKNLDRRLGVYEMQIRGEHGSMNGLAGYRFLDRYCRDLPFVEKQTFFTGPGQVVTYKGDEKIKLFLRRTDGEFWQMMDFQFLEGAAFTEVDEKNRNFVAVINEATRKKFFGNDSAVGKTIDIDGQNFRVVGVVSNVPTLRIIPFSDIWVPISTAKTDAYKKEFVGNFMGLFLARNVADIPAIKEEFNSRLTQVEIPDKQFNQAVSAICTFPEGVARFFSPGPSEDATPARLIIGITIAALLFMLLPTINLININISRIMERASEIGVRKAFGASSLTLVGQFIIENILLTLIGGVIGFVGSYFVLHLISQSNLIPYAEFQMNFRIFLYGLALAVCFGLLSGVYPAWKMSRLHPVQALTGGVR